MRLLPAIEEAWSKFEADAKENGAAVESENTTTYTQRDSSSELWLTRGKLVRLDHAVMAAHIMTARYSYFGMSKVWVKMLRGVVEKVSGLVGGAIAKKVLGKVVGRNAIGTFVNLLVETISDVPLQIELETALRVASLKVRSDIYTGDMGSKGRHRRATKLVLTRHIIPPQRRPNKTWRSPRA